VRQANLAQVITMPLSTAAIKPDGTLTIAIFNGDATRGIPNPDTISFPPDGLEISFPVSSFVANYARVILILWCKLAFLAMVAVAAATFLSFPVACLVAFGIFFCAESAGFLQSALENYGLQETDKTILWWRWPIIHIAQPIADLFRFYAEVKPTENL